MTPSGALHLAVPSYFILKSGTSDFSAKFVFVRPSLQQPRQFRSILLPLFSYHLAPDFPGLSFAFAAALQKAAPERGAFSGGKSPCRQALRAVGRPELCPGSREGASPMPLHPASPRLSGLAGRGTRGQHASRSNRGAVGTRDFSEVVFNQDAELSFCDGSDVVIAFVFLRSKNRAPWVASILLTSHQSRSLISDAVLGTEVWVEVGRVHPAFQSH